MTDYITELRTCFERFEQSLLSPSAVAIATECLGMAVDLATSNEPEMVKAKARNLVLTYGRVLSRAVNQFLDEKGPPDLHMWERSDHFRKLIAVFQDAQVTEFSSLRELEERLVARQAEWL
jgi:hypothetical protein